ncbi:Transmembrane protein [Phytophthora cinnamomi]|uniref:Transmembrane protein n=1 Tax=Phytophthora cinnamomi TaxID=4785 RepID=UPI0035599AE5|nr:Transmembrane protein [Phytophthora cinnamomi]
MGRPRRDTLVAQRAPPAAPPGVAAVGQAAGGGCLGVGSLAIPSAFYRAGLVMGFAMIVLDMLLSYMTVMCVCETVAREREA